jgi:Flp pilus assembly pilin Flp
LDGGQMNSEQQLKSESRSWPFGGEKGATMFEYAFIACCIAVVAIASVTFVGNRTKGTFTMVGHKIAGVNGPENAPDRPGL